MTVWVLSYIWPGELFPVHLTCLLRENGVQKPGSGGRVSALLLRRQGV